MIDENVAREILASADALRDELVELVSNAVQIPSVNPNQPGAIKEESVGGESKVNEFFKPVMDAMGLETDFLADAKGGTVTHHLVIQQDNELAFRKAVDLAGDRALGVAGQAGPGIGAGRQPGDLWHISEPRRANTQFA